MLLSGRCRVDVSGIVDRKRGDFFLGSAVEDERFAIGRNTVDKPAAVGAGNQISFGIERENANVDFIAFEKKRVLSVGGDFENFAVVAGGDIQVPGSVESEIPDVFGLGTARRI